MERCLGRWNEVWKLRNADSQKNFCEWQILSGMLQWMCVSRHCQLLDTQEQCHVRKVSWEQMYFCTFSIGDSGTFQHMMVQGVYSCYPSVSWSAENPRGVLPFVLQMQFALSRSFRNLFHKLCCKYAWHSVSQCTSSWLYNFLDLHVFTHTHIHIYIYIYTYMCARCMIAVGISTQCGLPKFMTFHIYLPFSSLGVQAPGDTGMSGSVLQGTELAAGDPLFSPGLNDHCFLTPLGVRTSDMLGCVFCWCSRNWWLLSIVNY